MFRLRSKGSEVKLVPRPGPAEPGIGAARRQYLTDGASWLDQQLESCVVRLKAVPIAISRLKEMIWVYENTITIHSQYS